MYVKLFSTLIHSTVWREDLHVKVVWITLLAMADEQGYVWASVPGLADAARVTLQQCEDALNRLSSPDRYSRTQEHEGRRLDAVDGGWVLLNYAKYRQMQDLEQRRVGARERKRRQRERSRDVTPGHALSRHTDTDTEAEEETEAKDGDCLPGKKQKSPRITWLTPYYEAWQKRYPNGEVPVGQMSKTLRPLDKRHGVAWLLPRFENYLGRTEPDYLNLHKFAATADAWDNASDPDNRIVMGHRDSDYFRA